VPPASRCTPAGAATTPRARRRPGPACAVWARSWHRGRQAASTRQLLPRQWFFGSLARSPSTVLGPRHCLATEFLQGHTGPGPDRALSGVRARGRGWARSFPPAPREPPFMLPVSASRRRVPGRDHGREHFGREPADLSVGRRAPAPGILTEPGLGIRAPLPSPHGQLLRHRTTTRGSGPGDRDGVFARRRRTRSCAEQVSPRTCAGTADGGHLRRQDQVDGGDRVEPASCRVTCRRRRRTGRRWNRTRSPAASRP
jgi:hypothetical protein